MADAFDFILFSFFAFAENSCFCCDSVGSFACMQHFLNSLHVFLSLTLCCLWRFYCSGRRRHHCYDYYYFKICDLYEWWRLLCFAAIMFRHETRDQSRDILFFFSFATIAKYDNKLCDATLGSKMAKWEAIQNPTFFAIVVLILHRLCSICILQTASQMVSMYHKINGFDMD